MEWFTLTQAIVVAVITGVFTTVSVIIQNRKSQAILEQKFTDYAAHTDEKIDTLSKHVEKHNQVVERTYRLEAKVDVLEKKQ